MAGFSLLPCPKCGAYKNPSAHTYGSYKVYYNDTVIKLRCKACGEVQKFRTIRGG